MALNIYMLLLACLCASDSSEWRQDVCMGNLMVWTKNVLKSEAAKKNTVLTYLQQMWHLMALLMQDFGAAKLQKKALFVFLTTKETSATLDKLLSNPFNWIVNQGQGLLSVAFTAEDLFEFVNDIFSLRNVFSFQPIDDTLEIPCAIIGAQLAQLGSARISPSDDSYQALSVTAMLKNILDLRSVLQRNSELTRESLEAKKQQVDE